VVLPLLESDLLEIMMATTNGTLDKCEVKFANKHACCVIVASNGYPESYKKGFEITIAPEVRESVYVAGAELSGDRLLTSGGRVLGVSATADTLPAAIDEAYKRVLGVGFEGAFYRRDIGARAKKALEENR
jgi:phosphoribosylamine--glycine ligase